MQHQLTRRMAVATLALAASSVFAQAFPDRTVRIVVPFPPGGSTDFVSRLISPKMGEVLGQSVIVDNRGGGNTIIGTEAVAKSPADGYTLLVQTTNLTVNPALYKTKLGYDPIKDFAPIALIGSTPHVLVVPASSPFKTLADYIAHAKANPGAVNYGSGGSGTVNHLCGEMLSVMTGVKLTHVPYKGSGAVLPDLLSAQIMSLYAPVSTVVGHITEGRLRALAVTTLKRSSQLPTVPTFDESGIKGYDLSSWVGILAPANTPAPVVSRLHAAVTQAVRDPKVAERLNAYDIYMSSPQEFATFLRNDVDKQRKLIEASGAKID